MSKRFLLPFRVPESQSLMVGGFCGELSDLSKVRKTCESVMSELFLFCSEEGPSLHSSRGASSCENLVGICATKRCCLMMDF